jgi:hypothetical protein
LLSQREEFSLNSAPQPARWYTKLIARKGAPPYKGAVGSRQRQAQSSTSDLSLPCSIPAVAKSPSLTCRWCQALFKHTKACTLRRAPFWLIEWVCAFQRFRIGSKLRCMRSTLTEMRSISENNFECLASTGVNAPGTMRQYRASAYLNSAPSWAHLAMHYQYPELELVRSALNQGEKPVRQKPRRELHGTFWDAC